MEGTVGWGVTVAKGVTEVDSEEKGGLAVGMEGWEGVMEEWGEEMGWAEELGEDWGG